MKNATTTRTSPSLRPSPSRGHRRSPLAAATALWLSMAATTTTTTPSYLPLLLVPLLLPARSSGYVTTTHDLSHRHMAGVWRLTGRKSFLPILDGGGSPSSSPPGKSGVPMKEFTVYPKKEPKLAPSPPTQARENEEEEEVLLMLDEDGSFRQYALSTEDDEEEEEDDDDDQATRPKAKFGVLPAPNDESKDDDAKTMRGTWDYLDGKLILAPDRPKNLSDLRNRASDTILEGEVVAIAEERMGESGGVTALPEGTTATATEEGTGDGEGSSTGTSTSSSAAAAADDGGTDGEAKSEEGAIRSTAASAPSSSSSSSAGVDVRLSVPSGTVATGKFVYPKTHPSFFEDPMHRPTTTGTFVLRQVLGVLNARNPEDANDAAKTATEEKFRREDLHGRTFFLTSHPLERRKPKGRRRWSIKYNKFVEDPPSKRTNDKSNKDNDDDDEKPVQIRVMEVQFHANNTFSTVAGLGSSTILRGKWDVVGQDRDHLWMQVWRFGFGRSVSGSVYSEGTGLTHNDEKAYWGRITEIVPDELDDDDERGSGGGGDDVDVDVGATTAKAASEDERRDATNDDDAGGLDPKKERKGKLEIRGSVLDGWGLEPEPVARFTMMEKTEDPYLDDEEEDDDDEEEEEGENDGGIGIDFNLGGYDGGDGDDYSSPDAFQ